MILPRRFNRTRDLTTWLNGGDVKTEAADGATTGGGSTLTSAGAAFTTTVAVGDWVHVDGEGFFAITTVTDDNNIDVAGVFDSTGSSLSYKVVPNKPKAWGDVLISTDNAMAEGWIVLYETDSFKVF